MSATPTKCDFERRFTRYLLLGVALSSLIPLVGLSGFLTGVLGSLLLSGCLCLAGVALGLLAVVALLVASHCEKLRKVGDARVRVVGQMKLVSAAVGRLEGYET